MINLSDFITIKEGFFNNVGADPIKDWCQNLLKKNWLCYDQGIHQKRSRNKWNTELPAYKANIFDDTKLHVEGITIKDNFNIDLRDVQDLLTLNPKSNITVNVISYSNKTIKFIVRDIDTRSWSCTYKDFKTVEFDYDMKRNKVYNIHSYETKH